MARQTTSRKSNSRASTKSTSKTRSTTKAPRRSRFSVPHVASKSQNTLTQIHFVPRFAKSVDEDLDLEYLELEAEAAGGEPGRKEVETVATEPRSSKPCVTSGAKKCVGEQKSKQKRKRKLAKDPNSKTLTQIGYVSRYIIKSIDDVDDLDYLPQDDQAGNDMQLSVSDVQSRGESHMEPLQVRPRLLVILKTGKGQRQLNSKIEEGLYEDTTAAGKPPKSKKRKLENLSPPKPLTKNAEKRIMVYQDASRDAESDYADDESPKRKKRQRVNTTSQGPIASRLRPRKNPVSYVGNVVTRDLEVIEKLPSRPRKGTRPLISSKPRTPVKTSRFEIPSSQSPGSTPLSIRSRPPSRLGDASPLRSPLTDLSAYSRMANSSKMPRLRDKSSSIERPFELRNMWPRITQQTATNTVPNDFANENRPVEQESQTSTCTTPSSLPDIATLFGPSRPIMEPSERSTPRDSTVVEPNKENDEMFAIGIETQADLLDLEEPGFPTNDDDLDSIHTEDPANALHGSVGTIFNQSPNADSAPSEEQSVSPAWLPEDRFEMMKPIRPSQILRQSQISTQDVPSSAIDPRTQDALHDPIAEPEISFEQASQRPKDLTQIWPSSDSSPSSPSASHLRADAHDKQESQHIPTNISQSFPRKSQAKPRDLTQIWSSSESGSQGVLTASQLLPASMMESLARPPEWTESQDDFSDEDWL